jgi:hypothetical protein
MMIIDTHSMSSCEGILGTEIRYGFTGTSTDAVSIEYIPSAKLQPVTVPRV